MIVFPNAKINIGLNVVNKRSDGYHDIETIFYPVGLHDILEFIPVAKKNSPSSLALSGIPVDGNPAENLCFKAYKQLKDKHGLPPLNMHLHKVIPVGSGLGGGSSDAAYMIKALDNYFHLNHTNKEMAALAGKLGADCAFFITNKAAFAHGKGEKLEPVPLDLSGYHISIIYPSLAINTKIAYSYIRPKHPDIHLKEATAKPVHEWKNLIRNDFEGAVEGHYPVIKRIKETLYNNGAVYAAMTGSGSSVYGLFDQPVNMKEIIRQYYVWEGRL